MTAAAIVADELTGQPLGCNSPAVVEAELIEQISAAIVNHPRSQQTRIGPSSLGLPCTRRLIYALTEQAEPKRRTLPWLPTIGTAVHAWLADTFEQINRWQPRYLVEQQVTVGQVGGQQITGSADLFDVLSGTVVDWKIVGKTTLDRVRRSGPGEQYRAQAHLYGQGFVAAGHQVATVMIAFLPRNSDVGLSDRIVWSEPFDPAHAAATLARAEQLHTLAAALGADVASGLYPPCEDTRNCPWCRTETSERAARPVRTAADPFGLGALPEGNTAP